LVGGIHFSGAGRPQPGFELDGGDRVRPDQRLADRERHLRVVNDQRRVAGQRAGTGAAVGRDDRLVRLELGRLAERVPVCQAV
jgi:hypothetical protein